jgi:hypothetical protein
MSDLPLKTSWAAALSLFKFTFFAALGLYLFRGWLRDEFFANRIHNPGSLADTSADARVSSAVRKFSRSFGSFLLDWFLILPWFVGGVCVSLLRDAGYDIIPWPIMFQGAVCGGSYVLVSNWRRRIVERIKRSV